MHKLCRCVSYLVFVPLWMSAAVASPITLIADPKVTSIPIQGIQEPFVDLRKQKVIKVGPSPEVKNNKDYFYLRKTVYNKLKEAQSKLPKGTHLCLYEGYRSLSLQKMLFQKEYQIVKKRHPDWSHKQLFNETILLVAPVANLDGAIIIPPHSTGAAIDVYLVDNRGKPLDMGIHPKDWMTDKGRKLSLTQSTAISEEAKKNRALMSKVLSEVGFANYPAEYWHWSYGDRYWAFMTHHQDAIYGTAKSADFK